MLDVGLAWALRRRLRAFRPRLVVAHHVEAAAVALSTCNVPVVYVAHTSLEDELPVYLPGWLGPPTAWAAARLERYLCRRAARTLAVSPLLARLLTQASDVAVQPFVLPWPVPAQISSAERKRARAQLGLGAAERVLLYAGNFDAYQGLPAWIPVLARFARAAPFVWLVASEAAPVGLLALLRETGLAARVRFLRLASEDARREAHAAADAAIVPRRSAGGMPIKLLDALARGVPAIANRRACAGTGLEQFCHAVEDDDAESLFATLQAFFAEPGAARQQRAEAARSYLQREHSPRAFVDGFEALLHGLG